MVSSPCAPEDDFDLVIVSNRLPYSIAPGPSSEAQATSTPGGLISALRPVVASHPGAWVGWSGSPGGSSEPYAVDTVTYFPVVLTAEEIAAHYEGFSNQTIWPLYHDVGVKLTQREEWWRGFREVNQRFAQVAAQVAGRDAQVWVHDYQLQLVPALLGQLRPDLTIGYFHHIPFPPISVLSGLDHRDEVLRGLLGADLLGFQRQVDVEHFDECVDHFLSLPSSTPTLEMSGGHRVWRQTHPISLDFRDMSTRCESPDVIARSQRIREDLGDPEKIFLGVDRLDYTKGIPERLRAFARALDRGELEPLRHVFVQLASPSRESVSSYQQIREEVEALVHEINSRYATPSGGPVFYRSENLAPEDMLAHYRAADVMVVSALRDGMNLVAKEYVACRNDDTGVLVLSENTGAADELVTALRIDPRNIEQLSNALVAASRMSNAEQARAMVPMRAQVRRHDVDAWARGFLRQLTTIQKEHSP